MLSDIPLYIQWYNVVNGQVLLGLFHAQELFKACPQVKEQADGHEPEFICAHAHLYAAVIEKPGKQLIVIYPAMVFFVPGSSSLSTWRRVPLNMASVTAFLYVASSIGVVSSSTVSSVSRVRGSSGCLRL